MKKLAGSVTQGLPNPFETSSKIESPARSPKRVAVRSEEEQHAAAKERERQEVLANRDARRKSLGRYTLARMRDRADMSNSKPTGVICARSYFAYMECC